MTCTVLSSQTVKIKSCDLNKKIAIYQRDLVPQNYKDVYAIAQLKNGLIRWAMVKSLNGAFYIDGVSGDAVTKTHEFYIRFDKQTAAIDASYCIIFQNQLFNLITAPENINLDNRFLKISCGERGRSNYAGNYYG